MNNLLSPKKTKFKKYQKRAFRKPRLVRLLTNTNANSSWLISTSFFWFSSRQLESARKVIVRTVRKYKNGKIILINFPDKPLTKKSEGSRMGVGKGSIDSWVSKISPGFSLFELRGFPKDISVLALKQAQYKIPGKTKIL